jgi:hypothetical protein
MVDFLYELCYNDFVNRYASVAQWIECSTPTRKVAGSIPARRTKPAYRQGRRVVYFEDDFSWGGRSHHPYQNNKSA